MQTILVAIEQVARRAEDIERAEFHGRLLPVARDAHIQRAFAFDDAVQRARDPPSGIRAARDHVIVGSAYGAVDAKPDEGGMNELWRLAAARPEAQA